MTPGEVLALVERERAQQEVQRKGLPLASDPALDWPLKLSALMEEVGEVARALNDDGRQAEEARAQALHLLDQSMVEEPELGNRTIARAQVWATLAVSYELSWMESPR